MSRFFSWTVMTSVATRLNVETATIRPITRKSVVCWTRSAAKRPPFIERVSATEKPSPAASADRGERRRRGPSGPSSPISMTLALPGIRESACSASRSQKIHSESYSAKLVRKIFATRKRPVRGTRAEAPSVASGTEMAMGSPTFTPSPRASSAPTAAPGGSPGDAARLAPARIGRGLRRDAALGLRVDSLDHRVEAVRRLGRRRQSRLIDDRRSRAHVRDRGQALAQRRDLLGARRERAGTRPPRRWRRSACRGSPCGSPRGAPSPRRAPRRPGRCRRSRAGRPPRRAASAASAGRRARPRATGASGTRGGHPGGAAAHRVDEALEEDVGVVRAGRRLGVKLRGEDRQLAMAESLERAVVEVPVRGLDLRGQRAGIDRETVVLRRDRHGARLEVADRVVGAAVPELQLEGLARRGRARGAGARGRCRRSAACR